MDKFKFYMCLLVTLFVIGCTTAGDESLGVVESDLTFVHGFARQDVYLPFHGDSIHVEVVTTPNGLIRSNRRVIILIPGTLANGAGYYDVAPGTGWNAAEILASAGYIVLLPDLPGSGESYRPANGRDANVSLAASAVRRVATAARLTFSVSRVDLYGETGVGTNVALLLAREPWVRTISASATFYREFGFAAGSLFDPGARAFVNADTDGYLPGDPMLLAQFFGAADPMIQSQVVTACLGPTTEMAGGAFYELYAIPFTVGPCPFPPSFDVQFNLDYPIVTAEEARAPALFIQGVPDPIGSMTGTAEMAAVYGSIGGGEATVVPLVGASHLMRFDMGISEGAGSLFWSELLSFLAAN